MSLLFRIIIGLFVERLRAQPELSAKQIAERVARRTYEGWRTELYGYTVTFAASGDDVMTFTLDGRMYPIRCTPKMDTKPRMVRGLGRAESRRKVLKASF